MRIHADPDPKHWVKHRVVDPDPHIEGKGKGIFFYKKKCKEIRTYNCKLIQIFKLNLHQLYCFLLLSNLLCFFQLKKTRHRVIFTIFLKLDRALHLKSIWMKNCWIRIRKKGVRIHSPGSNYTVTICKQ